MFCDTEKWYKWPFKPYANIHTRSQTEQCATVQTILQSELCANIRRRLEKENRLLCFFHTHRLRKKHTLFYSTGK
jgi:hypothetical protein